MFKVTLKDSTGKVIGTTTTDASGKYKFTDLDNGNYTVDSKHQQVTRQRLKTLQLKIKIQWFNNNRCH